LRQWIARRLRSVRRHGARGDWTVEVLRKIAHGAARGVAHLHRQGVVHRDIAARNVLLTEHDDPKVADFGMARLLDEAAYEQQTMNTVGPLKWMAPEQMDHRAYSKASDVFAFGVLLFEIFQREPPWKGVSLAMTAAKIMMGERMDVSSRKIPPATGKLMVACWAAKRKERPSMDDVQDALREDMASSDDER
jgi:serine/threonine protein kinase